MRDFERLVVGAAGRGAGGHPGVRASGASMRVVFTHARGVRPEPVSAAGGADPARACWWAAPRSACQGRGRDSIPGAVAAAARRFRIKVLGYSFGGVEQLALDLKRRLERIPRVQDVDANAASFFGEEKAFTVTLDPDRAALARYGLTARDFAGAVAREVRGRSARTMIEIGGEEARCQPQGGGRPGADPRAAAGRHRADIQSDAPVRIGDLARVDEQEALSPDQPGGPAVRPDRELRLPGPAEARQPDPRGLHGVHLCAAGLLRGRRRVRLGRRTRAARASGWSSRSAIVLVMLPVAMVFDSVLGHGDGLPEPAGRAGRRRGRVLGRRRGVQPGSRGRGDPGGGAGGQPGDSAGGCGAGTAPAGESGGSRPRLRTSGRSACRDRAGMIVLVTSDAREPAAACHRG